MLYRIGKRVTWKCSFRQSRQFFAKTSQFLGKGGTSEISDIRTFHQYFFVTFFTLIIVTMLYILRLDVYVFHGRVIVFRKFAVFLLMTKSMVKILFFISQATSR